MRTFKELRRDLDLNIIGYLLFICGALNKDRTKIRMLHPVGFVLWVILIFTLLPAKCLFTETKVTEMFEPIVWW